MNIDINYNYFNYIKMVIDMSKNIISDYRISHISFFFFV